MVLGHGGWGLFAYWRLIWNELNLGRGRFQAWTSIAADIVRMRILLLMDPWSRLIDFVSKSGFFGNFARFWKHLFTDYSLLILCRPDMLLGLLIDNRFTALWMLVVIIVYRCWNFTGHKVIEHLEIYLNEFGWLERAYNHSLLLFCRLSGLLWSGRNIWIWSRMTAELVLLIFAGQILARRHLLSLRGECPSICTWH